jgi:hypothetical protein
MATGQSLSKFGGEQMHDPHLFRSIVGTLQYVTITRPDIAFVVNHVSQFIQTPNINHCVVVKRILQYLKGSLKYGSTIQSSAILDMKALG